MKIIVATPMYPPEIAEPAPYVKEVSRRLSGEHTITIVSYANIVEKLPQGTFIAINKKDPLPIRLLKYTYTLFRASRAQDIIYVQGGTAAGLPAIIVGYLRGIPVVLRFSEDEAWERAIQEGLTTKSLESFLKKPEVNFHIRVIMWLQKFALHGATVIITTSHHQKDTLIRKYGIHNTAITVVYNPAPKEEIIPFSETKLPRQVAVMTTLTAWSGVDTAIKAVALLVKEFPDIQLVVAGEGPEKQSLKNLVGELGLEKNVSLLGHISRAEQWHIRKTSATYVESTLEAGTLDRISWSLSAGIPVIVNDVPVLKEGIEDGISGILVPPADEHALAEAVRKVFTDKDFVNALAQGRIKMLQEKFSWEAHCKGLNDVFLTLHPYEEAK